jgi:YHS domain-containing protein
MAHGNKGRHAGHDSGTVKYIDPVCGMEVDIEQGYGKMHEKQLYRFC